MQHAKLLGHLNPYRSQSFGDSVVSWRQWPTCVSPDSAKQCSSKCSISRQCSISRECSISSECSIMLLTGKGTAGFSRQDMFKQPSGVGVHMTHRVFCLDPCHGLLPGLGMLQNLPSAVVAHVLNPAPGSTVLDMCASPGGGFTSFLTDHTLSMYLVLPPCHVCCTYVLLSSMT